MNIDEREWAEEAIALCDGASKKGVTMLFIRKQDANEEADIIVTNAQSAIMVAALNGNYTASESQ